MHPIDHTEIPLFIGGVFLATGPVSARGTRGFLVKLDKRFSGGLQFTGSYAFSRYMNNVNVGPGGVTPDNLYETAGIAGNDIPHRFTFSGFYEVPRYSGDNWFLRGLLNNWQLGLISDMRSQTDTQSNARAGS